MSSSPVESDWLDDTSPLPQAGLIWPWILTGSLMFVVGVYLLFPRMVDRPNSPAVPESPSQRLSSSPHQPEVNSNSLNVLFVDSPSSSFAQASHEIDQQLRRVSGNQLGLALHPSGLYGGQKLDELAIVEQVRRGQAQIGLVTCSPLANFSALFEVMDLPFLFESYAQADKALGGPVGAKLLKSLEAQGMVGLGTMEVGFRVFSSSVPLPTLSDFRGKRVRVMQSSMAIQMARQLGCEAVPAPVDKIYQMGKEGYIDAADRTYPTYWDFKLYEVQRYITESRHSYTIKVVTMHQDFFNKLSPEHRTWLLQAVERACQHQRQLQRQEDLHVKQECRRQGIQIFELSPQERMRFVEACKPLYLEYAKLQGPELLKTIQAAQAGSPSSSQKGQP